MIRYLSFSSEQNQFGKLRLVGIPLAIVLFSAGLGWIASQSIALIVFGLISGITAPLILMKHPHWGHLPIIIFSVILPLHIPTGTSVWLNLTFILCWGSLLIWVLRMLLLDNDIHLAPSRTVFPALGFLVATTIALVGGNVPWIINAPDGAGMTVQLAGWSLYVVCIGTFLLFSNQIHNIDWLKKLTWCFLIVSSFYILIRSLGLGWAANLIFVPGKHLGSVFWIFLVSMAFGQLLYNEELRPIWRILLGVLVIGTFYVSFVRNRGWFSGWMPALLPIIIITWMRFKTFRPLFILGGLSLLLLSSTAIVHFVEDTSQQYTVYSRLATYPILFKLIEANPITGLGLANYRFFTPLYPILDWYIQFNSHNNYIDIVAQTGMIGLFFFLWMMVEIARTGLRVLGVNKDGFSQGYVVSALGGLAGMLVSGVFGDWFLPFIFNVGISGFRAAVFGWIFLAGLVALEQIHLKAMDKEQ